ncbi:MAG: tetratricopeptide repeat protein [Anaerolineae bacterium]
MTTITVNPTILLLLLACLYVVVFGGLSFARREGLSGQFVLESALVTAVLVGGTWLAGVQLSPFLFLALLYLVTMRSRLIVDLANIFAQRYNFDYAFKLYQLGLSWWPDAASRLIVLANRGAAELLCGKVETAVETLEQVLDAQKRPHLGIKYEAACRYNLGVAYERIGNSAKAREQFNEVLELFPGSPYARAASRALERQREKPPRE